MTETGGASSDGNGPDARGVAASLIHEVLRRNRPLDDALERHRDLDALAPRDRAFARLIVATVLRRLGQIDALIDHCLDRALPAKAARAMDALRTGVAQLAFLGTPPHAAADRTVSLLRGARMAPYRGLVNAVMRRLSAEAGALVGDQDAARLNTPDWLWRSWSAEFGDETCRRIAESHLAEAPLDITVAADAAEDIKRWAGRLDAEILVTGGLRLRGGGAVRDLAGYADGGWWVQDAAAALPARLLIAGMAGDVAGMRIADLCAAPGGKTAQLAAAGAMVTAVDRSAARLGRLRGNLARLGLEATLVEADAATWRPREPFDAVLLDAPCSGTGTIRRHPDIARLKSAHDGARLAPVQARLLDAAARMVRPGGILVYSVCSLQPEEGHRRISAFLNPGLDSGLNPGQDPGLDAGASFTRVAVTPGELGGLTDSVTEAGDLMTLPCHLSESGGLDGFYTARLRRQGGS